MRSPWTACHRPGAPGRAARLAQHLQRAPARTRMARAGRHPWNPCPGPRPHLRQKHSPQTGRRASPRARRRDARRALEPCSLHRSAPQSTRSDWLACRKRPVALRTARVAHRRFRCACRKAGPPCRSEPRERAPRSTCVPFVRTSAPLARATAPPAPHYVPGYLRRDQATAVERPERGEVIAPRWVVGDLPERGARADDAQRGWTSRAPVIAGRRAGRERQGGGSRAGVTDTRQPVRAGEATT